ncbi:uncharacterized protein THITE_154280 [Thermothielavioides terrestris NRRL 8126]|uniref:PEBP-like protein n=1 Tax=Thermothielavioides terrestris (strain ATCC 38088 / NRRL 8126) TaxID=578455 RepID=G2QTT7_THETT|nr:uncharacterized protein THITE_154280 [Thermothielavioides terrestris NRRL 8126]AEO62797.1 hypothetical protein THITE_154280 [Thermothielavioides terrestris NRRL 8126]
MASRCLAVLLAAASVLARTPPGFTPSSETDLVVEYKGFAPMNGAVVSKSVTAAEPRIGTLARLNGSSYAVIMIDLDIPTNNPPKTNTLLHWMQTGLVPAASVTTLNSTSGPIRAFLLENRSNSTALAPYIGPNPPARVPLSHRYTQILVDTSGLTERGMLALQTAAKNRSGFDAPTVLASAGLTGKVAAGNSFNVTNPGPAVAANTTGSAADGGQGSASGTAGGTGAGAAARPETVLVGGLGLFAVLLLGL